MKLALTLVVTMWLCADSVARAEIVEEPAPAGPVATAPVPVSTLTLAPTPAPTAPAPTPPSGPHITVMLAPIRLVIPVAEITVEYRVADKLGVSIELGAGQRTVSTPSAEATGTEIEGGAQVRYYLLGDFHKGVELGAEILDEHVTFDEPLPAGILGVAAGGVTAGPFVGYKVATHIGFTFEAQLGARYLIVYPAVTGQGSTSDFVDSRWLPLLHLNIGWSF